MKGSARLPRANCAAFPWGKCGCRWQPHLVARTTHSPLARSVEEYGTCDPL